MKQLLIVNDLCCYSKVATKNILPISNVSSIETAVLPTVLLSTHTGYPQVFKRNLSSEMLEIIKHFKELQLHFDAILTGYFYNQEQLELFVQADLQSNLLIVDPIMADNNKLYTGFSQDYIPFMRKLCSKADLIIPNLSEACLLSDYQLTGNYTKKDIINLLNSLQQIGCKNIIITSVTFDEHEIGVAALFNDEISFHFNQKYHQNFFGTGDLLSGLITSLLLNRIDFKKCMQFSVDFIANCIADSIKSKSTTILFEPHLHKIYQFIKENTDE